jgi:hypothetical protein
MNFKIYIQNNKPLSYHTALCTKKKNFDFLQQRAIHLVNCELMFLFEPEY